MAVCHQPRGLALRSWGFSSQATVNSWSQCSQLRGAGLSGAENWKQRGIFIKKLSLVSARPGSEFQISCWLQFLFLNTVYEIEIGLPGDSVVKNPPANAGALGLTPALGRSPGEENGNPLQYSCLENSMETGRLQSMGSQRVGHDWACTGI